MPSRDPGSKDFEDGAIPTLSLHRELTGPTLPSVLSARLPIFSGRDHEFVDGLRIYLGAR